MRDGPGTTEQAVNQLVCHDTSHLSSAFFFSTTSPHTQCRYCSSLHSGVKLRGIPPDLRFGTSYLRSTTSNNRSCTSQLRSGTFLLGSTTLLVESKHQTLFKCHESQREFLEILENPWSAVRNPTSALGPSGSSFSPSGVAPIGIHHLLLSNLTTVYTLFLTKATYSWTTTSSSCIKVYDWIPYWLPGRADSLTPERRQTTNIWRKILHNQCNNWMVILLLVPRTSLRPSFLHCIILNTHTHICKHQHATLIIYVFMTV